jgi:Rod binding domain-containing protein
MAASGGLGMGRMLQEQMSASAAFAKKSSGR